MDKFHASIHDINVSYLAFRKSLHKVRIFPITRHPAYFYNDFIKKNSREKMSFLLRKCGLKYEGYNR
jgi:hypothetical protein